MKLHASFVSAALAAMPCGGAALGQVQFFNLGTLPGGETSLTGSTATGLSADGMTVVGTSQAAGGSRAFVWTAAGMFALNGPPTTPDRTTEGDAISADGRAVFGIAIAGPTSGTSCRWTLLPTGVFGAAVGVGEAPGLSVPHIRCANASGSVMCVSYALPTSHSFRWSGGFFEELLPLPSSPAATAIDGRDSDGSGDLVVGTATIGGERRGFYWTPAGKLLQLPALPGSVGSSALSVTNDGSIIVGQSGVSPVRWTRTGDSWAAEALPLPTNITRAQATHISGDGMVVAGVDSANRVLIWRGTNAAELLQEVLQSSGVDVGGTIQTVMGINQNGTALVGQLRNNQQLGRAWYVHGLPRCGGPDFDNDGDSATDFDLLAFFACIAGNCCATCGSADFDGDGDIATDFDIQAFFRVLGGGSC